VLVNSKGDVVVLSLIGVGVVVVDFQVGIGCMLFVVFGL